MKLLIYAINGKGMGHLNRTLVLARALCDFDPSSEVRFVVGSPLFGLVSEAGFDVIKVPNRHNPMGRHAARNARDAQLARIFGCIIDDFQPDTFAIDLRVDDALFRAATSRGVQVALVLRKQRPSALAQFRRTLGIQRVKRFLVPHPLTESPLEELPWEWRARCRHLGPVARELQLTRIDEVRARYAEPHQRLIVTTIGGGGFAESFKTLRAAETLAAAPAEHTRWVIVYGPYYPEDIPPSDDRVFRVRFEPDLLELFAAADAIVCNAGYNTVCELELAGTPAVIVPLEGTGRDDQFERAALAESGGRALVSSANISELDSQLQRVLSGELPRSAPVGTSSGKELGRALVEALTD